MLKKIQNKRLRFFLGGAPILENLFPSLGRKQHHRKPNKSLGFLSSPAGNRSKSRLQGFKSDTSHRSEGLKRWEQTMIKDFESRNNNSLKQNKQATTTTNQTAAQRSSSASSQALQTNILESTFEQLKVMASVRQITTTFQAKQTDSASQHKTILSQARKLRFLYGNMSRKELLHAIAKAKAFPGVENESLLRVLESRLDVTLQRSGFCRTISCAKQIIKAKKVKINQKGVDEPGHLLKPGDLVVVDASAKQVACNLLHERLLCLGAKTTERQGIANRASPQIENLESSADDSTAIGELVCSSSLLHNFVRLLEIERAPHLPLQDVSGDSLRSETKAQSRQPVGLAFRHERQGCSAFDSNLGCDSSDSSDSNLIKPRFTKTLFVSSTGDRSKPVQATNDQPFPEGFARGDGLSGFTKPIANASSRKKQSSIRAGWRFKVSPSLLSLFCQDQSFARFFDFKSLERFYNNTFAIARDRVLLTKHKHADRQNVDGSTDRGCQGVDQLLPKTLFYGSLALYLRKELLSFHLKKSCFKQQKDQHFFKHQSNIIQKTTKPLHLEISYKSLSIIFLYPPQRICLPAYVDLDCIATR